MGERVSPRGLVALRPLRYRSYALLWSGGLVSVVGSWMQTVAVGALVVAHTGKATWAVVIAAGAFLPIGVLSPVGGALADRIARKPVLVVGNLVAAAVAAVIAVLVSAGHDSPPALALLVTVQGSVSALIGPFQQAILPDLVPRSEFLAAASLNSAQFNLGRVIGPAIAGVTVAVLGYPVAFVANAVSFLAVVAALLFVPLPAPVAAVGERRPGLRESLRIGLDAARDEPGCWAAIKVIALVAILASPFIALVPAMARRVAESGPRSIAAATAVLTTSQGLGAVGGALLIPPLAARLGRGRVLLASLALLPLPLAIYGFAPTLVTAAAGLFVVGLVYIGVLSGLSTVVQLRAPLQYRGRVLSFYLVALGVAYPLGSLVQGPIADAIGLDWTTAGSAGLLAVALFALRLFRPGTLAALAEPVPPPSDQPGTPSDQSGTPSDQPGTPFEQSPDQPTAVLRAPRPSPVVPG